MINLSLKELNIKQFFKQWDIVLGQLSSGLQDNASICDLLVFLFLLYF